VWQEKWHDVRVNGQQPKTRSSGMQQQRTMPRTGKLATSGNALYLLSKKLDILFYELEG
jgi:hypothetical protein